MLEAPVKSRLSVLVSLVLAASLAVHAAGAEPHDSTAAFPNLDVRSADASLAMTPAQADALIHLVQRYPDLHLSWNRRFGTPSSLLRWGATLSGARAGSPIDAARSWLAGHAALYGWSA
ncbi:MAG TPA: hypothetical protein VKA30_02550, partial [Actinomycetota bacterium]|nr:hypothetical protein [Actinomycetota bacterium]